VPRERSSNASARAAAAIGGSSRDRLRDARAAEGKEVRTIDGKPYVLEQPLRADFAFVKAWRGESRGQLVNRGRAHFNP